LTLLLALVAVPAAWSQAGGSYDLTWNTFDGGGASNLAGGSYVMVGGTSGQPDAGPLGGGAYALNGGFWYGLTGAVVAVPEPLSVPPERFQLLAARPNPFRTGTTFAFDMPRGGHARVEVYSLAGQHVRTLIDGERAAGRLHVTWDGAGDAGRRMGPGMYFVRVQADHDRATTKLVLSD
jgi:hypothetical protein